MITPESTATDKARPLQVLVVEDSRFDRELLLKRLVTILPQGSVFMSAEGGKQALALIDAASTPVDCVLLDLNLVDGNGRVLTMEIVHRWPHIGVVIVTGERDMQVALECMKAGAEDFLTKGEYTNTALHRSIRHAVERRRYHMESLRLNKALERERELSHMQKEFIHLVSHEFRTPLTIISGATQLLEQKHPEMAAQSPRQFGKIKDAVQRLTGLLEDVMRLNRLEDGQVAFSAMPFDLQALLERICMQRDDGRKRVTIKGEPLPSDYVGDAALMEHCIGNVLSNALKYSAADSPVTVRTLLNKRGCTIFIEDRGVGMPPDVLAQAGRKFYRAAEHSHIEGMGLGAFLARRFVEYHGGSMIFSSEAGKGTTVRIWLPHALPEPKPQEASQPGEIVEISDEMTPSSLQ